MQIYLSGGMSGLTYLDQVKWRYKITELIYHKTQKYDITPEPMFFIPPEYYNPQDNLHKTEREVMEFDLHRLRKSDLVIVNFNVPNSIGTAMELMLARELRIPIVGLLEDENVNLHPWLVECCGRIFSNLEKLSDYVVQYYLL